MPVQHAQENEKTFFVSLHRFVFLIRKPTKGSAMMNYKALVIVHASENPPDKHELDLCKSRALTELEETTDLPVLVLDGGALERSDMEKIRLLYDTASTRTELSQSRTALLVPLLE